MLLAVLTALGLWTADLPAASADGTVHIIRCTNCVALDTNLDVISSAVPGDKVIVQFQKQNIPDGKYTTKEIISDDVEISTDPNGVHSFTMPDKEVHLAAALYDRKTGTVDLTDKDTAETDFELLDSVVFTQQFSAYEAAEGNGSFSLDLNGDGKQDVRVKLDRNNKKATAYREDGSDDITGSVTVKIHYSDGLDWSRKYKECIFKVAREYCTVSFDANGGTGTMASVQVQKGKKYTLPSCGFTAPAGKQFSTWDKGSPGTQITVSGDTAVKAQWKDKPAAPSGTGVTEKVALKNVKNFRAKLYKKKQIKVSWTKLTKKQRKKIKKIEIQLSTDKKFKSNLRVIRLPSDKNKYIFTKLKKKTVYYIRVRTYTDKGNIRYVSKWSKTKKVKTRK